MSAFQLSANHIALLVDARIAITSDHHSVETVNRDRLLVMLERENRASIDSRRPGTVTPIDVDAFPVFNYHVLRDHGVLKILKALLCYEYQSCEHHGWKESQAREWCDELKDSLIARLPGFDTAEGWGVE